jgi:signal transduction histidine kinase
VSRSIRDVNRAELLPGPGRWAGFGMLMLFTVIATVQRLSASVPVTVAGAVLTLVGGALMTRSGRLPLLVGAGVATGGVVVLCTGWSGNIGWFAICVIAGWCALAGGVRVAAGYWVAAMVLFGAEWLWVRSDPGWGAWMAGTTFTVLLMLLVRHEQELVVQLRAAQASLADSARTEERNRIARELHDVIAHTLVVSQLHVASARLAVEDDPASAAAALAEAERLGRESLAEVRRTVGLLRTDAGGTAPLPGAGDLPALVERFRTAGTDVTLNVTGDVAAIPATTGLALYRVVQEALTNAVKHAAGWPVDVEVCADGTHTELVVESGGPPGQGSGLGLTSMRERAVSVGGICEAGPGGRGWLVRAEFPT